MEQPTETEKVARRVSEMVASSGVTVVWLCEQTGIPRSTMLRRLSGRSPFNINELARIAGALRVPTGDLVEPIAAAS